MRKDPSLQGNSPEIKFNPVQSWVREMLKSLGENPDRDGLQQTPVRVAELYSELFSGLKEDPAEFLETTFDENHHEPVIVANISFFSICEHHLLPFLGYVHVGYNPNGRVVGASKLARVIDTLSRRPQIQERLTTQIVDTIVGNLCTKAALVFVSAEHMCMTLRGVRKPGSHIVTVAQRGSEDVLRTLKETMSLASLKGFK